MTQNARGSEQIRPGVISHHVAGTAGLHGHPLWCRAISSLFLSLNPVIAESAPCITMHLLTGPGRSLLSRGVSSHMPHS